MRVSTFNWFATLRTRIAACVATEALELIPGTPYQRKGDPVFGAALIEAFKPHGVPAFPNASEHYSWDYAGLVPLLHMDPDAELAVVQIPTVLAADHDECRLAGRLVDEAARSLGKRAVFIASSALTHAVVRGRHNWPTPERMEMDRRMIELLCAGDLDPINAWFTDYSNAVKAEMGGRVVATRWGLTGAARRRRNYRASSSGIHSPRQRQRQYPGHWPEHGGRCPAGGLQVLVVGGGNAACRGARRGGRGCAAVARPVNRGGNSRHARNLRCIRAPTAVLTETYRRSSSKISGG